MKRILLIICIFNSLLSCSDDEKAAPELNVNPSILEFDYIESTTKIYISSNTTWESLCSQDWCTASISKKFGNDTVSVKVIENLGDERIAYISFYNLEKTVIKTVKIIQKARLENVPNTLHSTRRKEK